MVCGLGDPVWKVFLMKVSSKRVPYKCANDGTSKGSFASAGGEVYQLSHSYSM